jgi:hypothetical protein
MSVTPARVPKEMPEAAPTATGSLR